MSGTRGSLEARFWSKVDKSGECWVWTATINSGGYGVIGIGGRGTGLQRAHRLSAMWAGMDIEGKMVCHRCDNPVCVNPAHLFVGNAKDNSHDMVAKGRALDGEKAPWARLTWEKVREMRARLSDGETHRSLAIEYGVCHQMVGMIGRRERWKR